MFHWHFTKTACLGKIWFSSYTPKWLSANEISVFFNCQYFINRIISDFDFWHADRYEWKHKCLLTNFLKNSRLGKWAILGPKMVHHHESGSAVRIFFKFCTMEGANRVMKMILIMFSKNIFVWGKWTILSPKMAHHHETGSAVRFFLKFCRMKGVHEHFISCFLSKNFIWGKLIFLGHFLQFDWAWLKLSQATVTIGSLVRPWFLSWLLLNP